MLGLRPPGLEFLILCLGAVSSHSSHHPQVVPLAQFSLHVHKGDLKPHSFYLCPEVILAQCEVIGCSEVILGLHGRQITSDKETAVNGQQF